MHPRVAQRIHCDTLRERAVGGEDRLREASRREAADVATVWSARKIVDFLNRESLARGRVVFLGVRG